MAKSPRKKITADERKDWRNLPLEHWNTATVHAMVIELNAEKFAVEKYVPRSWTYEQGVIKRNLKQYGAEAVRETIERAFAEYRPSADYPQLTAGFLLTYMLPRIMPRVLAELETRKRRQAAESQAPDIDEVISWL
ncbi:hypothetical protein [Paenibacillus campinasensis]|uniref:Uncharacterized protein n=1 Tax=Paenibacillus campinasensis TaxID=66347 RepID=A0A268EGY5_9BACL|nr:hypothetical protein [Paenibacillus campinasensis]PAD72401.1 hypothetical protein CHH67_22430 [Paenibacillus campinasensis]